MREQYIKQVEKALHIPRGTKREVMRDLNEIFASALENGETEQQVIERLGTPRDFAENAAEQFRTSASAAHQYRRIFLGIAAAVAAAAAFIFYGTALAGKGDPGTIGQADAMTDIQIAEGFGIDIFLMILMFGIIAAAIAIIQAVRVLSEKRRQS